MPADTVDYTSLTLKKSIIRVDITANRDFFAWAFCLFEIIVCNSMNCMW